MQKTRKAVRKRFKVTGTGKVIQNHANRRHLAASKNAQKRRQKRRGALTDHTDTHRVLENLPFG